MCCDPAFICGRKHYYEGFISAKRVKRVNSHRRRYKGVCNTYVHLHIVRFYWLFFRALWTPSTSGVSLPTYVLNTRSLFSQIYCLIRHNFSAADAWEGSQAFQVRVRASSFDLALRSFVLPCVDERGTTMQFYIWAGRALRQLYLTPNTVTQFADKFTLARNLSTYLTN